MPVDVKICGLTTRDDALYALEMGADFLGFVLYAESPRGISARTLFTIIDRSEEITNAVGVFVNAAPEDVRAIAGDCGLCAVQLHGDEEPDPFADVGTPAWRAVKMRDGTCVPSPEAWPVDRFVVDANVPGHYGGTGQLADWDAASGLAKDHRVMLSGGLSAETVADGIGKVGPLGVDVSSGVESSPGRKDRDKIRAFITAAKAATLEE